MLNSTTVLNKVIALPISVIILLILSITLSHSFAFFTTSKGEVYTFVSSTRGGLCEPHMGICLPYILLNETHFQYKKNTFVFPDRTEKEQVSGEEEESVHKDFLVLLI